MDLKSKIRSIADFPQKGIIFRDITTLLKEAEGMHQAIEQMEKKLEGLEYDIVLGPESRGFLFGMPIAYNQKKGFVPVRKKGKLPAKTVSKEYALEYGTSTIEIHEDAIEKGQRVVEMVEEMGAEVVALDFLIELEALQGRKALEGYFVESVVKY